MEIRITTPDNFVFAIINEQAQDIYTSGLEIYKLFSDGGESLILNEHELNDAIDLKIDLGIEIGFLTDLKAEFEEGEQNRFRNNDFKDFDQWLEEKAQRIINE